MKMLTELSEPSEYEKYLCMFMQNTYYVYPLRSISQQNNKNYTFDVSKN